MKNFYVSSPLFLSLIWPSKTFEFVGFGYIVVLLLVIKLKNVMATKWLIMPALLSSALASISFIHILYSETWTEFYDLIRVAPLITGLLFARKATLELLYTVFLWLGMANLVSLYFIEYGYFQGLFEALHARDLENSYGRHSGLFLNVSTLGLFSMCWLLLAIEWLMKHGFAWNIAISTVASIVLLVQSGGKSQIVAAGSVILLWGFWRWIRIKPFATFVMLLVCSLPLFLHANGTVYLHQITKLQSVVTEGLSSVSSMQARFDIWLSFGRIWTSDPLWVLFGAPKEALDLVGNTFDSDIVWVLFRYGLFAAGAFLSLISFILFRGVIVKSPLLPVYFAMILSSFFVGVMTAFQFAFFYWIVTFTILFAPRNCASEKYGCGKLRML